MNIAKPALTTAVIVGGMLAISAWAYPHMAAGPIAVHWNLDGRPNGFAPRLEALLVMPVVAVALGLLFAALPQVMPANGRLERSASAYSTVWLAMEMLLALAHGMIVAKALGARIDVPHLATFLIAAMLLVIGNVLGKVRYNYVFGIRTPWTLSSERIWDRTHRVAGWTMVFGGLALGLLCAITPSGAAGDPRLATGLTICVIGPTLTAAIYSWWLSRRPDLTA